MLLIPKFHFNQVATFNANTLRANCLRDILNESETGGTPTPGVSGRSELSTPSTPVVVKSYGTDGAVTSGVIEMNCVISSMAFGSANREKSNDVMKKKVCYCILLAIQMFSYQFGIEQIFK